MPIVKRVVTQNLSLIICILILGVNWVLVFVDSQYIPTYFVAATAMVVAGVLLAIFAPKYAVGGTMAILFLLTFSKLSLSPTITQFNTSLRMGGLSLSSPKMNMVSLGLLLLHVIINWGKDIKEIFFDK